MGLEIWTAEDMEGGVLLGTDDGSDDGLDGEELLWSVDVVLFHIKDGVTFFNKFEDGDGLVLGLEIWTEGTKDGFWLGCWWFW